MTENYLVVARHVVPRGYTRVPLDSATVPFFTAGDETHFTGELYQDLCPETFALRQAERALLINETPFNQPRPNQRYGDLSKPVKFTARELHKLANALPSYGVGIQGSVAGQITARELAKLRFYPDLIITSSFRRSQQTAATMLGTLDDISGREGKVDFYEHPDLKPGVDDNRGEPAQILLKTLRTLPKKYKKVLVVGHDFTPTYLAKYLNIRDDEHPDGADMGGGYYMPVKAGWSELTVDPQEAIILSPRNRLKTTLFTLAAVAKEMKWIEKDNYKNKIGDKLEHITSLFHDISEALIVPTFFTHEEDKPAPIRYISFAAIEIQKLNKLSEDDLAKKVPNYTVRSMLKKLTPERLDDLLCYLEIKGIEREVIAATNKPERGRR